MQADTLASLLDGHAAGLILFARQWCATPEDVVQEAFVKLIGQSPAPRDAVAWLHKVVRNAALDAARSERRRNRRETKMARADAWFDEAEFDQMDAATVEAALTQLPAEQREIVVAHVWSGRTFEQIGATVGCAASSACRRYQAALARLRELLGVSCLPIL